MSNKNVYAIISIILLCILGSVMYFNTVLVDSQVYSISIFYLQGKNLQAVDQKRILDSYAFTRPLSMFIVAILDQFLEVRFAFSFVNFLFYVGSALLVYIYFSNLYKNKVIGYISSVLYATSLPIIIYGTRILSDVSGYFFIILGLIVIDNQLEKNKLINHIAINTYIGIALLAREYCLILVPYYIASSLFTNGINVSNVIRNAKENIVKWTAVIIVAIPTMIFSKIYGTLTFFSNKIGSFSYTKLTLIGFAKLGIVLLASFHVLWIFAVVGFCLDKERRTKYVIISAATFAMVFGGYLFALSSPRMVFIMFPVIIGCSAFALWNIGIKYGEKRYAVENKELKKVNIGVIIVLGILIIYAIISFIGSWLYPAHGLIAEDAGADVILKILVHEWGIKIGGLFS